MKLIVGLGNVGDKYISTRHNVGFTIVNQLAKNIADNDWTLVEKFNAQMIDVRREIILCKPQTMMNNSGMTVSLIKNYYKLSPEDVYIVHDDLDIKLGEYKIQKGKGPREHKGLLSIYQELGSKDLWHVRVGVDNRESDNRILGEDYVLMRFSEDELEAVDIAGSKIVDELSKAIH